jgi:hypothetical protein
LNGIGIALALAALATLGWFLWDRRAQPLITVGFTGIVLAVTLLALLAGKVLCKNFRLGEVLARVAIGIFTCTLGWLAAWLHLCVFDKLYLKWGRGPR